MIFTLFTFTAFGTEPSEVFPFYWGFLLCAFIIALIFSFSTWNVVQNKQNEIMQNAEDCHIRQKDVDIEKRMWYANYVGRLVTVPFLLPFSGGKL